MINQNLTASELTEIRGLLLIKRKAEAEKRNVTCAKIAEKFDTSVEVIKSVVSGKACGFDRDDLGLIRDLWCDNLRLTKIIKSHDAGLIARQYRVCKSTILNIQSSIVIKKG